MLGLRIPLEDQLSDHSNTRQGASGGADVTDDENGQRKDYVIISLQNQGSKTFPELSVSFGGGDRVLLAWPVPCLPDSSNPQLMNSLSQ